VIPLVIADPYEYDPVAAAADYLKEVQHVRS
jgi:hypothetical protein